MFFRTLKYAVLQSSPYRDARSRTLGLTWLSFDCSAAAPRAGPAGARSAEDSSSSISGRFAASSCCVFWWDLWRPALKRSIALLMSPAVWRMGGSKLWWACRKTSYRTYREKPHSLQRNASRFS